MAGLRCPSHGRLRQFRYRNRPSAEGRSERLTLPRKKLAFSIPNRFIPAHPEPFDVPNPEVLRLPNKLIVEPLLARIIVLPRDRIITQQKAQPHDAIHHMHNRHFVSSKHLSTSQPSHHKTPKTLNQ
jgi:hypothetical protein